MRGFGGGLVLRQRPFEVAIGYQRHWNQGLDNGGNGKAKAGAATGAGGSLYDEVEGGEPFKTFHSVNGGKVTQSAHVFTLGGVVRF